MAYEDLRLILSDEIKGNLGEAFHATSRKFMQGSYSVVLYHSINLVNDRIWGEFIRYFLESYDETQTFGGDLGISFDQCKNILQNWSSDSFMQKMWNGNQEDREWHEGVYKGKSRSYLLSLMQRFE